MFSLARKRFVSFFLSFVLVFGVCFSKPVETKAFAPAVPAVLYWSLKALGALAVSFAFVYQYEKQEEFFGEMNSVYESLTDAEQAFVDSKGQELKAKGSFTATAGDAVLMRSVRNKFHTRYGEMSVTVGAYKPIPSSKLHFTVTPSVPVTLINAISVSDLITKYFTVSDGGYPSMIPISDYLVNGFRIKTADGTVYTFSFYNNYSSKNHSFFVTQGSTNYSHPLGWSQTDSQFYISKSTGLTSLYFDMQGGYTAPSSAVSSSLGFILPVYGAPTNYDVSLLKNCVSIQFDDGAFLTLNGNEGVVSNPDISVETGEVGTVNVGTAIDRFGATSVDDTIVIDSLISVLELDKEVVFTPPVDGLYSDIPIDNVYGNEGVVSGVGALEDLLGGISSDTSDINENVKGIKGLLNSIYSSIIALPTLLTGDMNINFDALRNSNFTKKFPFCIPFDFYNCIKQLVAPSVAPVFELSFAGTIMASAGAIVLDMSKFDGLAKIIRFFVFFGFVAGLIKLTRQLIKG